MKLNFIESEYSYGALGMTKSAFDDLNLSIFIDIVKHELDPKFYYNFHSVEFLNVIASNCETKEQLSFFSWFYGRIETIDYIDRALVLVASGDSIEQACKIAVKEIIGT